MHEKVLVWFRRDLRLADHTALSEAIREARSVVPVFIVSTDLIKRESFGAPLLHFFFESLRELSSAIVSAGGKLIVRQGNFTDELVKLVTETSADAVYFNRDYEPSARQRDSLVEDTLSDMGCVVRSFKDQVLFEESEILTGSTSPYKVFTPFSRKWKQRSNEIPFPFQRPVQLPMAEADLAIKSMTVPSLSDFGTSMQEVQLLVTPGEEAANERARNFFASRVLSYHTMRDFPGVDGTSGLSAALRSGCIGPRHLFHSARSVSAENGDEQGVDTFINELIWRDFYQYILFHFPHVAERDFRDDYLSLEWRDSSADFESWCNGQTGYPIVDAGMRQLNQHGWMHNRLRMITASFLTKHLLIHWKRGERYFARNLVDYDLASNNGGWQWSASTGTDAQPYFRIFNPITQGKKFDANGSFIRSMCPELARVPTKYLFSPWEMPSALQQKVGCRIGVDYPAPVVEHAFARARALDAFERAKRS